jgi:hypothetical chaperone protein
MQTVFGLDFGTTNSALSVNTRGNTEVIDIDPHNPTEKTMRSVIFMDQEQGVYLGQEAIVQYIEQGGHGRFMQSIKSFLPSAAFEYTHINGKRYELEEVIALILKTIKERGEAFTGREVTDVVMGKASGIFRGPEQGHPCRRETQKGRRDRAAVRSGKDAAQGRLYERCLRIGVERIDVLLTAPVTDSYQ